MKLAQNLEQWKTNDDRWRLAVGRWSDDGAATCCRMAMHRRIDVEALCAQKGLRLTEQRRIVAGVLSESEDHPDVETVHERASAIDPRIP